MAFKHKETYGTVFKQDDIEGTNKHEYKGKCTTPDGKEFEVALWPGQTKEGKETFTMRIDEPYQKDESPI